MNRFKLSLDTESINQESEEHSNNFYLKVKNLAEHCVKFIEGEHNKHNCNDNKFNRDIHDNNQEIISIEFSENCDNIDNIHKEEKKYFSKVITHFFTLKEKEAASKKF